MNKIKLNLTVKSDIRRKAEAMSNEDNRSISSFVECLVALEWSRRMRGEDRPAMKLVDAMRCEDCKYITQRDEKGHCENCGYKAEPKDPRTPMRKRGDGGRKFRKIKARLRDNRNGFGVPAITPEQAAEAARSHRARVFNPQNIEEGDVVRLNEPRDGDPVEPMVVVNVGGYNCNKVFCSEVGHELYADCFELVLKKAEYSEGQ